MGRGSRPDSGPRELTDVDADTSGLLVERGPEELAFCHAALREHLAGLGLALDVEDQVNSCPHAGEPRWRGAILTLLQSLKRRADVDRMLEAIRDEQEGEPDSTGSLTAACGRRLRNGVCLGAGRSAGGS